jgi:hypothetical protein
MGNSEVGVILPYMGSDLAVTRPESELRRLPPALRMSFSVTSTMSPECFRITYRERHPWLR